MKTFQITLEPVDNGVIKTIVDNNINGAGERFEKKEIFLTNDNINDTQKFILSLMKDLGLYTGNPNDKKVLSIEQKYSERYSLTVKEKQDEKKKLSIQLNKLK